VKHITPLFTIKSDKTINVAIFLSGTGTNAEKILNSWHRSGEMKRYRIVIFTDRPTTSRAKQLSESFGLPYVANDIKEFYKKNEYPQVPIATPDGYRFRENWTNSVRLQLAAYPIDFGIFAGFIPLTNIVADFPCLNVHPGDLTYLKNNRRYLVGLHNETCGAIAIAIAINHKYLY